MPIIGWKCPTVQGSDGNLHGCGERDVPLDHFATTACGEWVCQPNYAQAVLRQSTEHLKRPTDTPTVTGGLYCPKESAILNQENVCINPRSENSKMVGTAWATLMDTDHGKSTEVDVAGTLWGVPVTGRADILNDDTLVAGDWKHSNDFMTKYVKAEGTKENYIVQLSLYAELREQSGGRRPQRGIVWHHFAAEGQWPVHVELWPLHRVSEYRPSGGEFTVPMLLAQTREWIAGKPWRELPLAGESQKFGKAKVACDFCSVSDYCKTAKYGAPF